MVLVLGQELVQVLLLLLLLLLLQLLHITDDEHVLTVKSRHGHPWKTTRGRESSRARRAGGGIAGGLISIARAKDNIPICEHQELPWRLDNPSAVSFVYSLETIAAS